MPQFPYLKNPRIIYYVSIELVYRNTRIIKPDEHFYPNAAQFCVFRE